MKSPASRFAAVAIAAILGSSGAVAQSGQGPDIAHGKKLVAENCGGCHATGPTGESPLAQAPAFRTLQERYPVDSLAEAFAEGIVTGHPDMPEFKARPGQIDDIIGYLASLSTPAADPDVAHGKALVETNCARCHATGRTGESPNPKAPAFRTLSERYPIDALEEAFAEGIVTGHPGMPEFEATPGQVADIIAYLASIQPR